MTTTFTTSARPKRHLGHIRVHDVMHQGIISVPAETPVAEVAHLMASRRVHAIAVTAEAGAPVGWKVVSALDAVAASASGVEATADQVAATEVLTISADERLDHAAQLMAEHELSHLIVTDPASGQPTGVLSTLDILAAVGG